MPRKRIVRLVGGRRKRVHRRKMLRGGNIFGSIWSGIKHAANSVNDFAKKSKILSTAASLIPHPGAKVAGTVLGNLGYGRRKPMAGGRRKRRKVGRRRQRGGASSLSGRLFLV